MFDEEENKANKDEAKASIPTHDDVVGFISPNILRICFWAIKILFMEGEERVFLLT